LQSCFANIAALTDKDVAGGVDAAFCDFAQNDRAA